MTKLSINIREASPDDVSRLSALIRESFQDVAQRFGLTPQNCPKHPSNCTDRWIESDLARKVAYYLAEKSGALAGCVALEQAGADLIYLERLAVRPECRRNGIGTALVGHIVRQAKRMGVGRIGIGIIANQTDLKSWYQRQGFVETGTKEFPYLPFAVSFLELSV